MTKLKKGFFSNSLFRQCYILCLFACNISYLHFAAYVGLGLMLIWGGILFVYNEVTRRTMLKTRYSFWLSAILIASVITFLMNILNNALINFAFLIHLAIIFFIYFSVHTEKQLNFRREVYNVSRILVYVTTVLGIVGLALLVLGVDFEFLNVKFIIYENRFTGLYSNPNYLGFSAVAALFCCHMLIKKDFLEKSGCRRVSRIWLGSCVAVNGISLLLCDSNGATVLLVGYAFFFVLYKMFGTESKFSFKQILYKSMATLLAGLVIVSSIFLLRTVCQLGFAELIKINQSITAPIGVTPEEPAPAVTFDHENKNLDSGRLTLWSQGIELFKVNPVVGIGKGNIYTYGLDKFENGVKFSDRYHGLQWGPLELGPFMTDLHNGYLTILVSAGALGFILFAIFGIRFFCSTTKHVLRDERLQESAFPCMFSFLCAYLFYSFIEVTLLFNITFTVVFFWMILGYTSCYLSKNKPEHPLGHYTIFGKPFRKTLF